MYLHHLSLANFRNYAHLELDLPAPVVLFQGDNGQGKSNILEAIYFLATLRSLRAGADREMINWQAQEETIPFARVAGSLRRNRGELKVEVVIRADRSARAAPGSEGGSPGILTKRIKVNGVPRRALELIGAINVVMFTPQDLELITGPPSLRRRHLDITNCQIDPRYCRALQQYNRVLSQRNHLLKQIRDGEQRQETLEFWSEELAKTGSYLLACRYAAVAALDGRVNQYFRRLTGTARELKISYRSTVEEALADGTFGLEEAREAGDGGDEEAMLEGIKARFLEALRRYRRREMIQAVSLVGPHRDDVHFRADGIDMNVYGSRGEQRAVALALKQSEVEFMQAATGERPILLLDDVMSELDPSRRRLLLETIGSVGQTVITATDLHSFPADFLSQAARYRIEGGTVAPLVHPGEGSYNQPKED